MNRNRRPSVVTARLAYRPAAYPGWSGELIWTNQPCQGHHRRNRSEAIQKLSGSIPVQKVLPARAGGAGVATLMD